ncbi:MAG: hypothetical protein ABI603_08390 [Acidobacteriota bacterium]
MTTESPHTPPPRTAAADNGLRRMLKWVFVILVLTVLFAMVVVALTIRWLS